jgi:hypothetical protein
MEKARVSEMIQKVYVPYFEKFLHLIAQPQRIVRLYQAREDEQDAYYRSDN